MLKRRSHPTARPLAALLALAALILAAAGPAPTAEISPVPLFADHMVLQREMPVPVWGTAEPGAAVTVAFAGQRKTATAASDGRWLVRLDAMLASAEGRDLVIAAGAASRTLRDVLVGEVWLASGQSNMEYGLGHALFGAEEIASADHPLIRVFTAATVVAAEPAAQAKGEWLVSTPANAGHFTAVGYFFARGLQERLGVPVGIIHSSVSGTLGEAWMSHEALASDPDFEPILRRYADAVAGYPAAQKDYEQRLAAWRAEHPQTDPKAKPAADAPKPPEDPAHLTTHPSGLFNGKIAPLIPVSIRGVIWWQGEYNSERCEQYAKLFPALIRDWRARWGEGDFPFLFVQAQNYDIQPQPNPAHYDELREAQLATMRTVANTGMTVACDVGDSHDIHPPNKQAVAARLVLAARALAYGEKDLEWSGPIYRAMAVTGSAVVLQFDHLGRGLIAKTAMGLTGFEIAGDDRVFVPAQAEITGDTVRVSSAKVPKPAAVRYAWKDDPVLSLYNRERLPASPFRTDAWPVKTTGLK